MPILAKILFLLSVCYAIDYVSASNRTFSIDYDHDTFLKDGQPFRYIAGTLHYFQIPRELWRDRMLRVRALGCNAIQTYVLWSRHEPIENQYQFSGDADLTAFLTLAQELGFVVILRPGPYADAEMDMGGFPYWLLKKRDITLRSSKDNRYMQAVDKWMTYLLSKIVKPQLYMNGGPVILVQIENEYGTGTDCDQKYMTGLRDMFKKILGNDVVLVTTDAPTELEITCGKVDGALPTIAFGAASSAQAKDWFNLLRKYLPKGPLVNSEFYPGWTDQWGNARHATILTPDVLNMMSYMWSWNSTSFTIYPAHGGTNWGYDAGSDDQLHFRGFTTSYDFDAPISEGGDTTEKFLGIRQLIEKLFDKKNPDPIPESPKKSAYGKFRMEWMGSVLDLVHSLTPSDRIVKSTYPLSMEELDQPFGFVLYETMISRQPGLLGLNDIRDRVYVIIDGQLNFVLQRGQSGPQQIAIDFDQTNRTGDPKIAKMHILVENQGRIAYGPNINDPKGLISNITFHDQILTNWTMYPIDLSRVFKSDFLTLKQSQVNAKPKSVDNYLPSVYYGYFFAENQPNDTFFDPSGWGKGQLFVNGHNIGRYWPEQGPQVTLYVPKEYLMKGDPFNQIYVFEMDQPGHCETSEKYGCWAEFTDKPNLN